MEYFFQLHFHAIINKKKRKNISSKYKIFFFRTFFIYFFFFILDNWEREETLAQKFPLTIPLFAIRPQHQCQGLFVSRLFPTNFLAQAPLLLRPPLHSFLRLGTFSGLKKKKHRSSREEEARRRNDRSFEKEASPEVGTHTVFFFFFSSIALARNQYRDIYFDQIYHVLKILEFVFF